MRHLLWIILVAALAACPATALELEPEFVESDLEGGFKVRQLLLPDGEQRVRYAYPAGWRAASEAGAISFAHPELAQTSLTLRAEHAAPPVALDDAEAKARLDWFAKLAGEGAAEFALERQVRDELRIDQFPVLELGGSYSAFGQRFGLAAFVLYARTATIHFVVVSPAATFAKAHAAVRQSLFTWRWEKSPTAP